MRPFSSLAVVTSLVATIIGCGSSTPEVATADQPPGTAGASEGQASGARKRLQGSWEIVRYESSEIPKEAMPLMAELFENLRIRFEGATAIVKRGKGAEERTPFEVADEQGDAFKLIASGGMFDGSECRFLGEDEWEATDKGKAWPGVSRLKRTP